MGSKALFLIHARESLKDDYKGLGYDVSGIDESFLESFCLALPPNLIPINEMTVGGGSELAKSMFLIHPRQNFKDDLSALGYKVENVDEETLESFCPALPPNLLPIKENQVGGGGQI